MRHVLMLAGGLAIFAPGAASAQSSPSNYTSGTRYDAARNVVGEISADPDGTWSGGLPFRALRNTYDAGGRLIRTERGSLAAWQSEAVAPADWVGFTVYTVNEYSYDNQGRKTSESTLKPPSAGGAIINFKQLSYDTKGRLECAAIRMNPAFFGSLTTSACSQTSASSYGPDRISKNVYDAAGHVVQLRKAVGTAIEQAYLTTTYTANGQREYLTDANGNKAQFVYDGLDRLKEWHLPSASTVGSVSTTDFESYEYDKNDNRTALRKRDGREIHYQYDAINRLASKTYPSGGARSVFYTYDLQGKPTAARFDSAAGTDVVLTSWDGFGRPTSSTTQMAGTSRALNYTYNPDGKRDKIVYPDGQSVNYYRYDTNELYYADMAGVPIFHTPLDAAGRVSAIYRWNISSSSWSFGTVLSYDDASRLSNYAHTFTNSAYNISTSFAINPDNDIITRTRDNDMYTFNGYVGVDRSYSPNGLNQYVSAGAASFLYDPNGNLTSDGTNTYGYDVENRLTSMSNGTTLTYDPLGRLWQTSGPIGGVIQLLYDGDALSAEYDGFGNVIKRYVHGDSDDDPLVQYNGSGVSSPTYLFSDHQGSIIAATDANGYVNQVNRYDEYGIPGGGNGGRFQFTGQAWIADIGMYYYKARVYSATLGRFLQADPTGYDDQVNLYAYLGNDPVNGRDPDGQCEVPTGSHICRNEVDQIDSMDSARLPVQTTAKRPGAPPGASRAEIERANDAKLSRYLAHATRVALQRACKCKVDPKVLEPLNPNAVRVTDPSKLPPVFSGSWSFHSKGAKSVVIAEGYVLKFYPKDSANGGQPTMTITTTATSLSHWINVLGYTLGDPVNTYNARQYCLASGGC